MTTAAAFEIPEIDFAQMFVHELGEGLTPSLVLAYHVADTPQIKGPLKQ